MYIIYEIRINKLLEKKIVEKKFYCDIIQYRYFVKMKIVLNIYVQVYFLFDLGKINYNLYNFEF